MKKFISTTILSLSMSGAVFATATNNPTEVGNPVKTRTIKFDPKLSPLPTGITRLTYAPHGILHSSLHLKKSLEEKSPVSLKEKWKEILRKQVHAIPSLRISLGLLIYRMMCGSLLKRILTSS